MHAPNKPVKLAHCVRWDKYSLAPSALSPASIRPLPESYKASA
ncbi:hypothetical protein [Alteromonas lipotrueae]|nr:hypothetical protein [Alteromonas lipotrueae]